MTGQDIQDRLDAIVVDLQTAGRGQTVQILMRDDANAVSSFDLSSDVNGVVNAAQLSAVQAFVDGIKQVANSYETARAPVTAALEAFKTASAPHQALADSASTARKNYNDAVTADANFQAAKTALDTARQNAAYLSAAQSYQSLNVSENFGNLGDAKGKYVI